MAQIRVMFLLLMYILTITTFLSDAKSIRNTEIQISSIAELFHLRESLPNVSERRKSKFDIYLHLEEGYTSSALHHLKGEQESEL